MRAQQKGENRDLTQDLEPRKKESMIPQQQEEDVEKTEDIEEKKKESESE